MHRKKKLDGRIAIVTGAAKGNGLGGALGLAKHGAKVYLADIDDEVFKRADEMSKRGLEAVGVLMDVCDPIAVKATVSKIVHDEGHIDILFNNAGVIKLKSFADMADSERDLHFDVNIKGVWNCARAVYPHMVEKDYGKIINMSSVTGTSVVDEGETAYATTKAAIIGFTKALAYEAARYGINVNAICPGYILTPMAQQIAMESNPDNPQAALGGIAAAVPLGRLGSMEEIGNLVAFLASDESSYLVGTQIVIDGGSTLPETFDAVGC